MKLLCWLGWHKFEVNLLSRYGWLPTIVKGRWVRECVICGHKETAP